MNNSLYLEMYKSMLRISMVECEIANRYYEKVRKIRTPIHLYNGEEAIAVGVCSNLKKEDIVFSNHRSHGHYLAKGGNLRAMISELYSKETGCCGGKGGSMHLCDMQSGVSLTSSIVAGNIPIATGNALANKIRRTNNISCVFFGDGATEEGTAYESICFAALKKLPILYICENNKYAINTPLEEREPSEDVCAKFANIIPSTIEYGNDIEAVYDISKKYISDIREGCGPRFIEFKTYRTRAHSNIGSGVNDTIRTIDEWNEWSEQSPIKLAEKKLAAKDKSYLKVIQDYKKDLQDEIENAFIYAEKSPFSEVEELYTDVWS